MLDPRFRQAVAEARAALVQHRLRTVLSGLGIVIGVASISAVLAMGDGLEAFAREQIAASTGVLDVILAPQRTRTVAGERQPLREEDRFALDAAGLADLAAGLPGLAAATLWEQGTVEVAYADTAGVLVDLVGVLPGGIALGDFALGAGRDFTAADLAADRPVCLVPAAAAARLLPGGEFGTLRLEDTEFAVIGLLDGDEVPPVVVLQPRVARIDIDPSTTSLPSALFRAVAVEDVPALQDAVGARLDAAHPDWRERATLVSYRTYADQAARGLLLFKAFMVAITGIALLVGGIGIMNVLLMSVGERTREIGIRRAMGARAADIRRQVFVEAVLMCGAGAALGAGLGIAGAYGIAFVLRRISGNPFHAAVTWPSVAFAIGASVVVGMVFGILPARRAAGLQPVDAIRHE
ncbi:ABC transporter permease [bacterium]|nr:ABC transporter permease [bacterium]